MAQKLKQAVQEHNVTQLVMTSAQQIWLAGLGAFSKAQQEGGKMFDSLVKEGESIQARAGKLASEQVGQVTKTAAGAWDKLEQVFEERVAKSLNSIGVPTFRDIEKLSREVTRLNESVQALMKGDKPAARAPVRRAVKAAKATRNAPAKAARSSSQARSA